MKPQHDFTPARAAAQHCPELLARRQPAGVDAEAEADGSARLADLLTDELPAALQPLLGKRIRLVMGDAEEQKASWLMRKIGRASASYAVSLGYGLDLLVSFDLATAHRLTDRLFGGTGAGGGDVPEALPLSASLALERIVKAIIATLDPAGEAQIARGGDVAKLAPFARTADLLCWAGTVSQEGHEEWSFRFAGPATAIAGFGAGQADAPAPVARGFAEAAQDTPFEALPLPLVAVLAETRLPLARLAALRAGDLIPLPFQREVPLRIGGDTVAHGSIGTLDERVALQLTRIA